MTKFNLLKNSYSIKNTTTCRHDTLNGFVSDFSTNGDVNGWDIYSSLCLYGAWASVLFGTSLKNSCFIGRSTQFYPVNAEKYHILKIVMRLIFPENSKNIEPTKGKIAWQTSSNQTWTDNCSKEFDLVNRDQWYTYVLNMGEETYWIGDIINLRIYPTIDGYPDIKFNIKSIAIASITEFTCTNTQCSFYTRYTHPCLGAGSSASITSGESLFNFTTISGISDKLILNIDDYGDEQINLGNNINLSGHEMSKVLINNISKFNAGQYAYAEVSFQEEVGKITIFSGAIEGGSSIEVSGPAAEVLGFIDHQGNTISEFNIGKEPASGFDFGSSRRLKGFELTALIDSDIDQVAYYHNPNQYNVEAGRRDFVDSTSATQRVNSDMIDCYNILEAPQKLIIDVSHPINDSGKLFVILINGNYIEKRLESGELLNERYTPKVFILRPDKYNNVRIIHEIKIAMEDQDIRYTEEHVTFRVDCDILVNKGDLVGFYNLGILTPCSAKTGKPNVAYFEVILDSENTPIGKFDIGYLKANGVVGFSFYARSNRLQKEILLDIDMGKRINIEELSIYGKEYSNYFEYNIASCLDVNWVVDCHNETHKHNVAYCNHSSVPPPKVIHRNKCYGVECLSDCITTIDGGKVGDSYTINSIGSDPDVSCGIETIGEHSYFYVNGDAEWLNGGCGSVINSFSYVQAEFKYPWMANVYDYEFDPISFYLIFPDNRELKIHKSIIYFKETQNFKCYSLSYYLGDTGGLGNTEESHFQYIPKYNSIVMDGIYIYPDIVDTNSLTQLYTETLFKNPTPWAFPKYVNDKCVNWAIYQTTMQTQMNVLEHDFDEVKCEGFKIHTTWHKSTKIVEIELYSKIFIEASLLDNIEMQTSVYGEYWDNSVFLLDENNTDKMTTYITNSPRYFKIKLQSQDTFELKEISAVLSDNYIKSLNCKNTVLLTDGRSNSITKSELLEIENVYQSKLNLSVDIPNLLFEQQERLVSWIRFDSNDTSINSEVGPGAIIRKSKDYELFLENGMIAINTPSYYLKNLVDNKKSYVFENEHIWQEYKTLEVNKDVDYESNTSNKSVTIDFLPVSSKYWKLGIYGQSSCTLNNLSLYHNMESTGNNIENNVLLQKIYLQAELYNKGGKFETTIDTETNTINPAIIINYNFLDSYWYLYWDYYLGFGGNSNFVEKNGAIHPLLDSWETIYIEKEFLPGAISFDMQIDFRFDLPNNIIYLVELLNPAGETVLEMKLTGHGNNEVNLFIKTPISVDQEAIRGSRAYDNTFIFCNENIVKDVNSYTDGFIFTVYKKYNTLTEIKVCNSDGTVIHYNGFDKDGFVSRASKLRISYINRSSVTVYDQIKNFGTSYVKFNVLPVVSDKEFIIFEFDNSQSIDTIKFIFTGIEFESLFKSIFISHDGENYTLYGCSSDYSNNLAVKHKDISTSEIGWAHYLQPWAAFDDDYVNNWVPQNRSTHWLVYDFGSGNERIIKLIYCYITTVYYYYYDHFPTLQVYGSNTYKVYSGTGISFSKYTEFDLSVATLLAEVEIQYYNDSYPNEILFANDTPYRYIIFYWPEVPGTVGRIYIKRILMYEFYSNYLNLPLTVTTSNYINYLAIDLEQVHNLDFLRNYGSKSNLLRLAENNTEYSDSDTDDINKVIWEDDIPTLLLNFDDYSDSADVDRIINIFGSVSLYNSGSPVIENGYIGFGISDMNPGWLEIDYSSDFRLLSKDFTIDFWFKRYTVGHEGIFGQVDTNFINSNSSFSFTFSEYNHLIATIYIGDGLVELISLLPIVDTEWYHVALTRYNGVILLFINGNKQGYRNIGETTLINSSVEKLIVGKVNFCNFIGYLDELRILIDKCNWSYNFNPPEEKYIISSLSGEKTAARWIRFLLECGDDIIKQIQYLGIYPDICVPFLPTGGYNCEWESIGTQISNYSNTSRNLTSKAHVLGEDLIYEIFGSELSDEWSNVSSSSSYGSKTVIEQTDFKNSSSVSFWKTYWDNFNDTTSVITYTENSLKVTLGDTESGDCGFTTKNIIGDCSCEVNFKYSANYRINSMTTVLRITAENGHTFDIRRILYGDSYRVKVYDGSGALTNNGYTGIISRMKIKKIASTLTLSYMLDGDYIIEKTLSNNLLLDGEVYFSFIVEKEEEYPSVDIYLCFIKLLDEEAVGSETCWGTTASGFGFDGEGYGLEYKTTAVPIENGPIFKPNALSNESHIESIEYYYFNTGSGGGGLSILDSNEDEVFGIATFSPEWGICGSNGWEIVNSAPETGNNSWYKVKLIFDWVNYLVTIEWANLSTHAVFIYEQNLILNTNASSFQIKSTFGIGWGIDYTDIVFDNIIINPKVSYLYNFYQTNCVLGDSTLQGFEYCWGWDGSTVSEPTLIVDFGSVFLVDKFVLYHRPSDDNFDYMNNDFSIYGATSTSGSFELLVEESNYSEEFGVEPQNIYKLDIPAKVRLIKLVITKYTTPDAPTVLKISNRDGGTDYIILDGGFLREFEVWSCTNTVLLNSEDHPIVCMDLLDQFNLNNHSLSGPKDNWSNENQFFQFSDEDTSDPNKVSYSETENGTFPFQYTDEYFRDENYGGEFVLDNSVFLPAGHYDVLWKIYNAKEYGDINLSIVGLETIVLSSIEVSDTWITQTDNFNISNSGYFTIKVFSVDPIASLWGVKEIYFKNFFYTNRWVAVRRNTAINFVWDDSDYDTLIDNKAEISYLSKLQLFTADKYKPTEYSWWWESAISELENDKINVKVGRSSLKIIYPNSEKIDNVHFLEGDHFGKDINFSIKDALSFWFYISDIDKLNTDTGSFVFGSLEGYTQDSIKVEPAMYIWAFKYLNMVTGWNEVKLQFDKYTVVYPDDKGGKKLDSVLNFKEHLTSSFGIVFQGKGQSFELLVDDLKIERNYFYDEIVYGDHGICLTGMEYVEIPVNEINTNQGTIEMWIKLYSNTAGVDHFSNTASKTLFTIVDSSNNLVSLSIRSGSWFEIGVGNTKSGYKAIFVDPIVMDLSNVSYSIDDILHIALVWNNKSGVVGNSDTVRLYINGKLYLWGNIPWSLGDSKSTIFRLGGGNTYLANNDDVDGSAIFSNVKVYNYCKTEFEINKQQPKVINALTPNDLVQISKDNINFYTTKSEELPFEFKEVEPGEIVPIYIRVDKTKMDQLDKLTGSLDVEWKIPV